MSPETTQPTATGSLDAPASSQVFRWLWALRMPALLGLAVATYLVTVAGGGGQIFGCGDGGVFDCGHVLRSRWSQWLGLPVSGLGAIVFALILLASAFAGPDRSPGQRRAAWWVIAALAVTASGAAAWFIYLQALLEAICLFCMASHAAALATAAIAGAAVWRGDVFAGARPMSFGRLFAAGGVGLAGLAMLVGVQIFVEPPSEYRVERPLPPVSGMPVRPERVPDGERSEGATRRVVFPNARLQLVPAELPLIGSPDAEVVLLEFMDYACAGCRRLHPILKEAKQRYRGELAIVVLPWPLNPACNPGIRSGHTPFDTCAVAELALSVWRVDPAAFPGFHDWLMARDDDLTVEAAEAEARSRVDPVLLRAARESGWAAEQLQRNIEAARLLEVERVPTLAHPMVQLVGVPPLKDLMHELELATALEPAGATLGPVPDTDTDADADAGAAADARAESPEAVAEAPDATMASPEHDAGAEPVAPAPIDTIDGLSSESAEVPAATQPTP